MTRRRHRIPSLEGTWGRFFESTFCHEKDSFPRILLLVPTFVALIFGFVFALSPTITAADGVKPAFAAVGFVVATIFICYMLSGLPIFRVNGCASGCAAIIHASLSLLYVATMPKRQQQHVESLPEFELPQQHAVVVNVAENPLLHT
jgi:hypothetical protein